MGKSSKNSSTTNTISEPWEQSQPLLQQLLDSTGTAFNAGQFDIPPFPDQRVAPQSGLTQESLGQFGDLGTVGNSITPLAGQGFEHFMNADPYRDLDVLKQNALGDIMPGAMSRFSGAGMLDSTLAADAAGRAATEAIAPIEYGAWNQQQSRKLGALGMAPRLAANQYLDAQMLGLAGDRQDSFDQRGIDASMAKYYEGQNQLYDELQRAASLAMGFGGMGGTEQGKSTQPGGGAMGTAGGVLQTLSPLVALGMMI